jgi:hypothetical protein
MHQPIVEQPGAPVPGGEQVETRNFGVIVGHQRSEHEG